MQFEESQRKTDKAVFDLMASFQDYAQVRKHFLSRINLSTSCRDPLAEFSEMFSAVLLEAKIADSRVQKEYDLIRPNGRFVQVKYLCNSSQKWVNEHTIYFNEHVDDYALVIFENLDLRSILIFPRESVSQAARLLQKRHAHQDKSIQFTQRNYKTILVKQDDFSELGIEIFQF